MMMRTKRTRTKKTTAPTIRRSCASRTRTNQDACSPVTRCATAAMADNQYDCQNGIAMIKAELKKKHPAPVLLTLPKALSDAETEVIEEDWSECMDHIKTARAARSKEAPRRNG